MVGVFLDVSTDPTHAEMRFMAFAAIINGATGLLFSMAGVTKGDPAIWPAIERLVTASFGRDRSTQLTDD